MTTEITEHDKVVAKIRDSNSAQFKVLANLGEEQNYIGQMFPDLIFLDKTTEKPLFIIEVRKNGNIAPCIQQWKSALSIPATLYIIVPEPDMPTAKSVAQVVGLQTRFGHYTIDNNDNIIIKFE